MRIQGRDGRAGRGGGTEKREEELPRDSKLGHCRAKKVAIMAEKRY